MRKAGVLFPIFSLPGVYGIGSLGEEAYRFADFLKKAGQKYWQILPVGPTGYGDSPYQSFSTFAGNPYFINLENLIQQGLLTEEECRASAGDEAGQGNETAPEGVEAGHGNVTVCAGTDSGKERGNAPADPCGQLIDYGRLYRERWPLLRKAFRRSRHRDTEEFTEFQKQNAYWLADYALFMAIKDAHGGAPLESWEDDIRAYDPEALGIWREKLREDVDFYEYLQYEFFRQWRDLKNYVNDLGIGIIGDIPIYVSADSADFWAHRELFLLDERGRIRMVAGVPPDGFSATGQLWGNPLYEWSHHEKTGYEWWIRRIGKCCELYDVIRIDHFRGFDEFFAIPASDDTAANGHWEQGPGLKLFDAIRNEFPDIRIIAEDLGYMKDSVRKLVKDTGFPNMKVLEFAFDSRDSSSAEDYLPYNYDRNCVVYTGTHDNETARGWLDSILPEELRSVRKYLAVETDDPEEIVDKLIRMGLSSVADLCIIPLQDYLCLDNSARINQPSTHGKNWKWRVHPGQLSDDLAKRMAQLAVLYGR